LYGLLCIKKGQIADDKKLELAEKAEAIIESFEGQVVC